MYEHGYLVKYETPSYPHQLFWQPVVQGNLPDRRQFVWVLIPEHGNEDEGYGGIRLARLNGFFNPEWENEHGDKLKHEPVFWAPLWAPEYGFVVDETPEECRAHFEESRRKIVECTGPWAYLRNDTAR